MAIYKTSSKVKLYLGATKVKKVYLGTTKIYSSGNIVTYIVDGSAYHTQEYEEGQSVLSPSKSPTKSGYTFLGWSTSASGNILASLTMGDSPITLYAQFIQTAAWNFGYTGGIQTWVVPVTGLYLLTCYGAKGGDSNKSSRIGGAGGTTKKYVVLNKGQTLYVVCGEAGIITVGTGGGDVHGGYNGGGRGPEGGNVGYGSGGGATHIATSSGLLSSVPNANILAVAGGGGGCGRDSDGGAGGGTSGVSKGDATGGTQSSGYAKGQGGPHGKENGGGGGGGYYGGFGGNWSGAGGGSGYIGSSTTTFKGKTYTNTTSQGGNNGNGFASIQFIAA